MKHIKSIGVCFLAVMISLFFSPSSGIWGAEKISEPFNYSGYTAPEYGTLTRSSEYVTMNDGVKLAATVYLPSGGPPAESFPVIFSYTAYHREVINPETGEIIKAYREGVVEFFTSHGYAMVMADKRGTGASFGVHFGFSPQFATDGKELVDWIANQSWCNGNVGMIGLSYLGWSQYATAGRKPAALKCILPEIYGFDLYTAAGNNPGGIYARAGLWGTAAHHKNVYNPNHPYPIFAHPATPVIDEDGDGELADEIPMDLDGDGSFVEDYQLPDNPPQYKDGQERQHIYYMATYEHLSNAAITPQDMYFRDVPFVDGYTYTFEDLNPNDYPARIAESGVAIYNMGAWFDGFIRGTAQWHSTLSPANPSKMLITPGNHSAPGLSVVPIGPYWEFFGEDTEKINDRFSMERLRFFDHYLKGIENNIDSEPPVYIHVMNGEGWRFEDEWPLARQEITSYYFDADSTLSGDRKAEGTDVYQADFTHDSRQDTTLANRWNLGIHDRVDIRTDKDQQCLTYTSSPLEQDTEVTGHPVVRFWVSSTVDYGDFFVYLEDMDDNGDAYFVTDGMLRAGFAKLVPNEDMLPPGADIDILPDLPWHGYKESDYVDGILAGGNIVELVFDLMPTSWVFRKGHRFRVSIACADWPTFRLHHKLSPSNDPEDPDNIVPTITVHRTDEYPSRIELPIIPSEPVEKISEPFKYSGYTSPEYTSFSRSSEYVTMSDGVKLASTIYMPSGGAAQEGPFPALFTYLPYHRENINPETGQIRTFFYEEAIKFFTSYGYAWIFVDMRGTGASFGSRIHFFPPFGSDGKELVEWIAEQPWCNGDVGMVGSSYLAWSQFATAGKKPDALKCIMPESIGFDLYMSASYYPGGIYNKGMWDTMADLFSALDQNIYSPFLPVTPVIDEDGDGDFADEIPLDRDGDGSFLDDYQLPDNPPQYSDGNERQHIYFRAASEHLANQEVIETSPEALVFRDTPGNNGYTLSELSLPNSGASIAELGIPVFKNGGWFDCFSRDTLMWYSTLAPTNPVRIFMGPNNHSSPGLTRRGHGPYWEYFGEDIQELEQGFNIERLRFLDHYLKGTENGIDKDPAVNIYVMNGQGWRSENEWPLARQEITGYFFEQGNTLSLAMNTEGTDDYQADFTHDSRQEGNLANRWNISFQMQDHVDLRTEKDEQCLTYTSGPMEQDTEVTGHPVVHLWASSTSDYGDFFAYLEDVDENGESYFVTDGMHRAGFGTLMPNENMLSSGTDIDILPDIPWHGYNQADFTDRIFAGGNIAEVVFDLMPVSWVFKEGHRIRVSIACADWPTFSLHPGLSPTNDPEDPDNIIPMITVHRGEAYPSRIELPVIPAGSEYERGDADGNGKIDIDDALIIAQYDVELKTQYEVPGFAAADVDGNGKVDIFDALRIAEFVVGLIPEL